MGYLLTGRPDAPGLPLAAIRMITADYQGGGEYDIRARERANGTDGGAWANGKVFFPDGLATLSDMAPGERTRVVTA